MIIENVAKKKTERVLVQELMKMTYEAQGLFINSGSMGVCQSRTRLYVAAVDLSQLEFIVDPGKWSVWLKDSVCL